MQSIGFAQLSDQASYRSEIHNRENQIHAERSEMIKKELFLTVNNLRKRIEELEKKLFEIQNPTKFEIGQKINYTPSTYWQLNVWDELGSSFPAIILKQEITNSSIGFRRSYEIYDLQRKEYYSISENQINEVQEEKS